MVEPHIFATMLHYLWRWRFDLVLQTLVFPHQLAEGALVAERHRAAVVPERPLVDKM